MEICADCGKKIGMLEPSYYRKGDDDIGRAYHAACGDPYGLKAKDAEIELLRAEIEQLKRRPSASDIDPTAGADPHWNWGRQ